MEFWDRNKIAEICRFSPICGPAPHVKNNVKRNLRRCPLSVIFAFASKIGDRNRSQDISDVPSRPRFKIGDAIGML